MEQKQDLENVRLNNVMFKALDNAVDSVKTGSLIAFVMTENAIQRFSADTLEECKLEAEKYLASLTGEPVAALAYDGYLTVGGKKWAAVFVKAFDINEKKGMHMAQRYEPKKLFTKFQLIGNPALVEYLDNPWI